MSEQTRRASPARERYLALAGSLVLAGLFTRQAAHRARARRDSRLAVVTHINSLKGELQ